MQSQLATYRMFIVQGMSLAQHDTLLVKGAPIDLCRACMWLAQHLAHRVCAGRSLAHQRSLLAEAGNNCISRWHDICQLILNPICACVNDIIYEGEVSVTLDAVHVAMW